MFSFLLFLFCGGGRQQSEKETSNFIYDAGNLLGNSFFGICDSEVRFSDGTVLMKKDLVCQLSYSCTSNFYQIKWKCIDKFVEAYLHPTL